MGGGVSGCSCGAVWECGTRLRPGVLWQEVGEPVGSAEVATEKCVSTLRLDVKYVRKRKQRL